MVLVARASSINVPRVKFAQGPRRIDSQFRPGPSLPWYEPGGGFGGGGGGTPVPDPRGGLVPAEAGEPLSSFAFSVIVSLIPGAPMNIQHSNTEITQ